MEEKRLTGRSVPAATAVILALEGGLVSVRGILGIERNSLLGFALDDGGKCGAVEQESVNGVALLFGRFYPVMGVVGRRLRVATLRFRFDR